MQVFNANDPNVVMLEQVARSLGPELCRQFVFVGGAAAGLLITDVAMPTIRRTDDVRHRHQRPRLGRLLPL